MTSTFQPPPTYANPVIVDRVSGESTFNPIWLKWFVDIAAFITSNGGGGGGGADHTLLSNLNTSGYYHLTGGNHTDLTDGTDTSLHYHSADRALGNATGTLAVANGGTGVTTSTGSGAVMLAPAGTQLGAAAALVTTAVALNNGAAAAAGTLTNAPAAGNPTKWVPINDNGTTRYIPAW